MSRQSSGDQPARPSGGRSLDWQTGFVVAAADSRPNYDAFALDASHGLRATVSAAAGDALGLGTANDPPKDHRRHSSDGKR